MNRTPLAHILLHYGAGDGAFLIDGWKVPAFVEREFDVTTDEFGIVRCTVTFLCDEVTVLSPWEPRRIAAEIVKKETR